MSDKQEGFVFYRSFYKAIKKLDDHTLAETVKAICAYALDGEEVELEGVAEIIFDMAQPQIDANTQKRGNGALGGRPRKKTNGFENEKPMVSESENQRFENEKPNNKENNKEKVKVKVKEKENEKVKEKEKVKANEKEKKESGGEPHSSFVPPSVDEVIDYCLERNNSVDAQAFIDFYTSKGWMIGKTKMRDWKAAVRTWESRDKKAPPGNNNRGDIDDFFRRNMGL